MSNAISKAHLETRIDGLQTKVAEAASVTNQMLVGSAAAFGAGIFEARMPGAEVFGVPIAPLGGLGLAMGALMGVGGKKSRRTMLSASAGLLYPWLYQQGLAMGGQKKK